MALAGGWIATLGSFAAAFCNASSERLTPGAIHAADIFPFIADDVERGRRAEIHDHQRRAITLPGRERVYQPVGAPTSRGLSIFTSIPVLIGTRGSPITSSSVLK